MTDARGPAPPAAAPAAEAPESAPGVPAPAPGPWLLPVGAAISTLGAICGIGGGLFSTPILHYGFRFELRRAIATSLALVTATALSATLAESLRADSAVPWSLVGALVPAALAGTHLGYCFGDRLGVRALKSLFCVALSVVGLKLLLGGGQAAALAGYQPGLADHLGAALLGLAAGFVVPVLGIGGGMLMVPGMLLIVPEVGYLGARATSLAVASVTASRSVILFVRSGRLAWRDARWIASGALLGAFGGVQLVHIRAVAATGQVLLAVILLVSALRFGLDVWRLRGAHSAPRT